MALNTALEICFLIALDLDELEQKGVLEEEFSRYQRETDIEKIQKVIGANLDMTEERLEEYNLLFLDISAIYRRQNIYGKFLKPLAKEAAGLPAGDGNMAEASSDPFCRRNILCACNNRDRASIGYGR